MPQRIGTANWIACRTRTSSAAKIEKKYKSETCRAVKNLCTEFMKDRSLLIIEVFEFVIWVCI